jgi:hypothetical protein
VICHIYSPVRWYFASRNGVPNRRVIPKTSRTTEVRAPSIPTVSRELAYATTPHRDIIPYDGLNPTVPVNAAGSRTEPPVSVPRALDRRCQPMFVDAPRLSRPTHGIDLSQLQQHFLRSCRQVSNCHFHPLQNSIRLQNGNSSSTS